MLAPSGRTLRERRALRLGGAVETALQAVGEEAEAKGVVLEVAPLQEWVVADGEDLAQVLAVFVSAAVKRSSPGARLRVEGDTVAEHVEVRIVGAGESRVLRLPAAAAAPTDPLLVAAQAPPVRERPQPPRPQVAA